MFLSMLTKIINALPPVADAGGGLDGVYVNMENYTHLTAIIQTGVGAPATVTVEKDADGSGAGTAIGFTYRICTASYNAAGGDTLGDPTAVANTGVALSGTDNTWMVIELDSDVTGPSYPYVRVCLSGVVALESMIYVLSGPRYSGATVETALTV